MHSNHNFQLPGSHEVRRCLFIAWYTGRLTCQKHVAIVPGAQENKGARHNLSGSRTLLVNARAPYTVVGG